MAVANSPVSEKLVLEFDPTLNAARQALYRYLGLALLDPRGGNWSQLSDQRVQDCVRSAAELIRTEPTAEAGELALGEFPLDELDADVILAILPDSEETLNAAFEGSFGLLITSSNPPHETEYIGEKLTFQRSQHLADIAGFYRAFGLEPTTSHPEREDHIVLELEFMAFLIGLERQAVESSPAPDKQRLEICRHAQASFLQNHLVWWVPTFVKLLSNASPESFYASVGKLLSAFLPAERALLGVEQFQHSVGPRTPEKPEDCDGCILHSL